MFSFVFLFFLFIILFRSFSFFLFIYFISFFFQIRSFLFFLLFRVFFSLLLCYVHKHFVIVLVFLVRFKQTTTFYSSLTFNVEAGLGRSPERVLHLPAPAEEFGHPQVGSYLPGIIIHSFDRNHGET